MKRLIYQRLIEWKIKSNRKPLILEGARQTGKTYILKEFGKKEFKKLIYCNFEQDPNLKTFFESSLTPKKIIESLSIYFDADIKPDEALIFFDEIQESNLALNSLKYFCEDAPEYAVVAAGSLLGVKMSVPKSFPVGKVELMQLYPMNFSEFLQAYGKERYLNMLGNTDSVEPFPELLHNELCDILRKYYFVGGMPEAVSEFLLSGSYDKVRAIQENILRSYELDFAKHANSSDVPKISIIWDSIPLFLSRENKRFTFSAISKSARAREYETAIMWLVDAGLIHKVTGIEHLEQPLTAFPEESAFKIYVLDVGLLGALARLKPEILVNGNELFTTFNGAFVENYVVQQLISAGNKKLYYWRSESRKAEIDLLVEHEMLILPLEIKAGINAKSKSLSVYSDKYKPKLLLRTTLLNLKYNGDILNVPLYAMNSLRHYLSLIGTSSS
ncbi:MAG: ATP-binding protein [Fibrobacteres bacterium]|nr:ATP-binding protein [Fibrobacterota bacterium]